MRIEDNQKLGVGVGAKQQKSCMKTFFNYLRESIAETRHIKWPTRQETILFTVAVVVIALVVAYYLGLFDIIFARLLESII